MHLKLKRGICVLMAAFMLLSKPCDNIFAQNDIDVDKKCSITIDVPDSWDDLKSTGFEAKLYKVASIDKSGSFKAIDDFNKLDEGLSGLSDKTTAEAWADMATSAVEIVQKDEITASDTVEIQNGTGTSKELETGLYLVYVDTVSSKTYGYDFTPYLVSAPNNEFISSGSGSDAWVYDNIEVDLKPSQHELTGDLEIHKTLASYNTKLGNPIFVFDVEAVDSTGEVVFSDAASIEFTSGGINSVVIKGIPAGADVTVTEVYAGGSYEVTSSDTVKTKIIAGEKADVNFTNDYSNRLIYGTGVVNHFEYDGTGWKWVEVE